MKNSFKPIYLQDAKRHVEWLYEKLSKSEKKRPKEPRRSILKNSIFFKIVNFLKAVF